jgi:hypothetical protein
MTLNVDTEKADKKNNLRKKRFTCPTKSQLGASSIFNRQTHLRIYFKELSSSFKKFFERLLKVKKYLQHLL